MGLFSKKSAEPQSLQDSIKLVRNVLEKLGIDGAPHPMDKSQGAVWIIQRGSAVVHVMVGNVGEQAFFKVVSPILYLPSENLLPLYRSLLEINMNLPNAALAVQEDRVLVVSERSVQGLDAGEADEIIKRVACYADDLDDKLAQEFGARLYSAGPR